MAKNQLILNRYRPISEAGAGGFGTVQVAWDTRIQRKVAIKCIELDDADAARAALPGAHAVAVPQYDEVDWDSVPPWDDLPEPDEFQSPYRAAELSSNLPVRSLAHLPGLDEARTAAMLSDSNIVTVYDFEVQDKTAYLIMEYIEGITLAKLLRDYANYLTLDMVAAIFSSVAHALEVAHDNQVLHLDIKPDNVLINRQGQVKVTDFGLAKLADASGFGAAGGGTIGYMPLEQMRGENLDARCDEWALAAVTYEMLAGNNPFVAPDLARAETVIEEAELVLPSLCWETLDAAADDVVFYALDPDREARYDNVVHFAEEMEQFLGDAKRGHRELAVIVGDAQGEQAEEDEVEAAPRAVHIPLRDRLSPLQLKVMAHACGAGGSALIAFVALANIPPVWGWGNPLFWGLLALIVLGGALKPHLGVLLSLVALSAALIAQNAPAVGVVLVAVVGAWWFFFGRHGNAAANTALGMPLAGALGASPLASVMAGLFLAPAAATATAALVFVLALIFAGFGSASLMGWDPVAYWNFGSLASGDTPAAVIAAAKGSVQDRVGNLLVRPETWCVGLSWILAALVQSACRLRVTRLFDLLGAFLACTILLFGAGVAEWLALPLFSLTSMLSALIPTAVAGGVGIILATQLPCERVYENYEEEFSEEYDGQ